MLKLVLFGKHVPVPKDEPGIIQGYFNTTPEWLQFYANGNIFQLFDNLSLLKDHSDDILELRELTRDSKVLDKMVSETDVNRFLYNLVIYFKPKRIIEVGVYIGTASCHLSAAQRRYMKESDMYLIDINQENLNSARKNLMKFGLDKNVKFYAGDSKKVAESGRIESSDLIFIDADHTLKGITRDINTYWSLLNHNGIMLLHDSVAWNGVRTVANNFSKSENPIFTFATSYGSGISVVVKRSTAPFDVIG